MTKVKYLEVSGSHGENEIQAVLDTMRQDNFELFQVVPNIDDRRGNPSVTAGVYLFFKETRGLANAV
jgi:hypothetical protein